MNELERLHLTRTPTIRSQVVGGIGMARNEVTWEMREDELVDLAERVFPDVFSYLEEYRAILAEPYYLSQPRRRPDSKHTFDPFGWRSTVVKMFGELVLARPMFIEVEGQRFRIVREAHSEVHIDRISKVVYELSPINQHVEA